MKTKILIIALFCFTVLNLDAQTIIDNGNFKEEVTTVVRNPKKAPVNSWFIVNNEKPGFAEISWQENDSKAHPFAVAIDNSKAKRKTSWYKAYLAQRIKNELERGVYRLTFYAKSNESNTTVSAYIKQTFEIKDPITKKNNSTFFVRHNFDDSSSSQASAAQYNFTIKKADKWVKVLVDYDLSKVVNTINSQQACSDFSITETALNARILKDCFLAILSQEKGVEVEITQVTLEKK